MDRGIVLVSNMGEDSILCYEMETYRQIMNIRLKPAGSKLVNTSRFNKGPVVGPGNLLYWEGKNKLMVVNVYDDSLSIFDMDTLELQDTIFAGSHPAHIVILEEMDRAFITNYDSDSISVIDLTVPEVIGQIPCGIMPQSMVVEGGTKHLYIANTGSDYISVIDAVTLDRSHCLKLDGYPVDLGCDSARDRLYIIVRHPEKLEKDKLVEYDMVSRRKVRSMELGWMPVDILQSPGWDMLYAIDAIENSLKIIDIDKFSIEKTVQLGRMPVGQDMDDTGKYLHVVCMVDDKLYRMDAHTGEITKAIGTGKEPTSVLCIG